MKKQHILVVDDEPDLCALLQSYLSKNGYEVTTTPDGPAMDAFLEKNRTDLLILDLMLPGEDGLSIGRRLHQKHNIPIIILSARGDELDRIIGLEVGADDYLAKPFNPRELLARIRAVLRRYSPDSNASNAEKELLNFGPFTLDTKKHRLTKEGTDIALTAGEFTLLETFLRHQGQVIHRSRLLQITRGFDSSPLDRSIDVCVGRLRKKIEPDPSNPIYLRTAWGTGYIFSDNN